MFKKSAPLLSATGLSLGLLLTLFLLTGTPATTAALRPHQPRILTTTLTNTLYLPLISRPLNACAPIPGVTYGQLGITNQPTTLPAAEHPDMNLAIRGYIPTSALLTLIDVGGDTDPLAPQLRTLFATPQLPIFTAAWQVHNWDWNTMSRAAPIDYPPVTLLGMATAPGNTVHVPDSGYDIQYGYDALVLYASTQRITLRYGREDHPGMGYAIHIENICVEPSLLALYESLNAAGRWELPAVYGGQAIGRAWTDTVAVAVRDWGTFMDPRVRKDWWKDY